MEPTSGAFAYGDSTGWAWARNAPFRYYKQNQFEGGIGTPGIVHWPKGLRTKAGAIERTPVHLIDVLPTLADLGKAPIPNKHPSRKLRPVSGISLKPIFEAKPLERKEPIYLLFQKDMGLRMGDWKAVSFKGQTWELYNLDQDRTENNNLADQHPERLEAMVKKWKEMTKSVLHSEELANRPVVPTENPRSNSQWTKFSDSMKPPAK